VDGALKHILIDPKYPPSVKTFVKTSGLSYGKIREKILNDTLFDEYKNKGLCFNTFVCLPEAVNLSKHQLPDRVKILLLEKKLRYGNFQLSKDLYSAYRQINHLNTEIKDLEKIIEKEKCKISNDHLNIHLSNETKKIRSENKLFKSEINRLNIDINDLKERNQKLVNKLLRHIKNNTVEDIESLISKVKAYEQIPIIKKLWNLNGQK